MDEWSECPGACPAELPVKCPDGLCALSAKQCGCPEELPVECEGCCWVCWVGFAYWGVDSSFYQESVCVATHADCDRVMRCPETAPFFCADFTCQESLDLCSSVIVCPPSCLSLFSSPSAHIKVRNRCVTNANEFLLNQHAYGSTVPSADLLCPDFLHHTYNTQYCPATLTCSDGFVLCDDNTCRSSSFDCPVSHSCPKYTCPFGSCADSYEQCSTNSICKKGYRMCSDRLCHPRSEKCPSYVDEYHNLALHSGKKLCKGGEVIDKGNLCPSIVGHLFRHVPLPL